ncbi:MAG: PQQ-binding-like beta-propeller repeat protein, partial [Hymenobacter sp.]|nr:PQQ-binding-like beta-propeller repeat protein [Hymenobacter sp.]
FHPSGKIYAPLLSGELAAIDASTGREIWRVRNADPRTGATLSGCCHFGKPVGSSVFAGERMRGCGE